MKKLIAMILAAAMLLSLTACGSTAADAAADNPEAETASADASAETPPEKPDGTPPDGANGQPGTPPDGNPPDGAPNGQPGSFGGGRRLLRHERRAAGDERRDRHDQKRDCQFLRAERQRRIQLWSRHDRQHTITTTADNSGGIQTTGGGTTNAENLTITTSGNSSAAIRSDRGGGTVNVTGGSNGAQVEFTADAQTLEGNILVDTISTLDLTLQNSSSFTGTINIVDNAEGGAVVSDNAVVTIGSGCTWTLTGDCTITSLTNNGKINFSGHTITLADGTVLR